MAPCGHQHRLTAHASYDGKRGGLLVHVGMVRCKRQRWHVYRKGGLAILDTTGPSPGGSQGAP